MLQECRRGAIESKTCTISDFEHHSEQLQKSVESLIVEQLTFSYAEPTYTCASIKKPHIIFKQPIIYFKRSLKPLPTLLVRSAKFAKLKKFITEKKRSFSNVPTVWDERSIFYLCMLLILEKAHQNNSLNNGLRPFRLKRSRAKRRWED